MTEETTSATATAAWVRYFRARAGMKTSIRALRIRLERRAQNGEHDTGCEMPNCFDFHSVALGLAQHECPRQRGAAEIAVGYRTQSQSAFPSQHRFADA